MITQPGQEITWDELRVGSRSIFAAAGFAEVSHPTLRRVVMRIDFCDQAKDEQQRRDHLAPDHQRSDHAAV